MRDRNAFLHFQPVLQDSVTVRDVLLLPSELARLGHGFQVQVSLCARSDETTRLTGNDSSSDSRAILGMVSANAPVPNSMSYAADETARGSSPSLLAENVDESLSETLREFGVFL